MYWETRRSRSVFTSVETLDSIGESYAAKLAENRDQYRALTRRTRTLPRKEKEKYFRAATDDIECS